jgi:8-oxo-dGTP diphosphatase
VNEDGILLAKHSKKGSDYWVLPGGGLEKGESFAEATRREVLEETGYEVRVGDLLFLHQYFPKGQDECVVDLIFEATITGGELTMGKDWNLAAIEFVPPDVFETLEFLPPIRDEISALVHRHPGGHQVYLRPEP